MGEAQLFPPHRRPRRRAARAAASIAATRAAAADEPSARAPGATRAAARPARTARRLATEGTTDSLTIGAQAWRIALGLSSLQVKMTTKTRSEARDGATDLAVELLANRSSKSTSLSMTRASPAPPKAVASRPSLTGSSIWKSPQSGVRRRGLSRLCPRAPRARYEGAAKPPRRQPRRLRRSGDSFVPEQLGPTVERPRLLPLEQERELRQAVCTPIETPLRTLA